MSSILQDEGKSWSEFYKFVNGRKGKRETIPLIEDCNGGHITNPVENANFLNNYNAPIFSRERVNPDLFPTHSDRPFTINISIIRERLAIVAGKKSVEPDGSPRALLQMGGEAMIPCLARLLEIKTNNGTTPMDWKKKP